MSNVSTRQYERVIPQMADTVGASKSSVSREFVEQSGKELKRLSERRFEDREFLVIYLDGVIFGEFHVLCAVGVDSSGEKVVLGIKDGASENAATAVTLLEDLVDRGIDPGRRYLFVIDGAKALRSAIDKVFGRQNPVQRCRNHIVGRDPRLPEGWNVPSRVNSYEPGSLGSGAAEQSAVSKQTRHVSLRTQSGGTGKRSGRTERECMAPSWHLGRVLLGESGNGWSSRLCFDEDSNDCGCIGTRSSRHPRRFEQRHERKESVRERSRSCAVGGNSAAVSGPIRRKPKWHATLRRKSEEAIE